MAVSEAMILTEQAEVILSNLLALRDEQSDKFRVSHDDVVVSLETAVRLLQEALKHQ